jgi:hypothetical protein
VKKIFYKVGKELARYEEKATRYSIRADGVALMQFRENGNWEPWRFATVYSPDGEVPILQLGRYLESTGYKRTV